MNNTDKTTGLKRILFFESAAFRYADLDIESNTLLLGDSGVGKTSIMRAVLFFYAMDHSKNILGITDGETKKSFLEWYFDVRGASHIVYVYETVNGRFLFIVSRHKNLKYTFVNITEYKNNIEDILLDESKRSVAAEDLDIKLSMLNLEHYSTTKINEYKKIFIKNEYPGLGASFLQKNLNHVKYYLFKDMSDIQMYGKYLSKIFLSNKVSEASIKEILTSLVSLDNNNEQYSYKIDMVDIDARLDRLQKYENDHNRFSSRLKLIDNTANLLNTYYEKQKKFTQNKESLVIALDNKGKIVKYFEDKIKDTEETLSKHNAKKEAVDRELGKEITNISALIIANEKSIASNKKEIKKYADMNIEQMVVMNGKKSEYEQLLNKTKQELSLLTSEKTELKNKTKQEELKQIEAINKKYKEEENALNEHVETLDKDKETLESEKEEQIRAEITPLRTNLKKKEKEHNDKKLKLVKLTGDINILRNKAIDSPQIIILKKEISTKNEALTLAEDEAESISSQIKKVEKDMEELSNSYTKQREEIEEQYHQKSEVFKSKIAEFEEKKHNLSNYSSDTLFGKISRDESIHRDKIINIVNDEILYDENIQVIKKDNSDSLFGYEVNFSYPSYENKLESLKEKIRDIKTSLSILDANHKKELTSFDKVTRLKKEKNNKLLKELTRTKTDINTKITNIKNQIQELQNSQKEEIKKETALRDMEISKMQEFLDAADFEENAIAAELEKLEKLFFDKEKQIHEEFKKKSNLIKAKKEQAKEKLKALRQKNNDEITKAVELIWQTYKDILQKQGVDTERIESLTEKEKEYSKILQKIEANRMYVYNYLQIKENLEETPALEEKLIELKSQKTDLEMAKSEKIKTIEKTIEKITEHLLFSRGVKQDIERFYVQVEDNMISLSLNAVSVDGHYFPESELQYIESNINDFCNKISIAKDLKSDIRDIEDELKKKTNEITKGFAKDNTLSLPIIDDIVTSIYDYITIVKSYIDYKENKMHEHERDLSLRYISETISYIKASIDNIRFKIESIETLKNEINKIIGQSIKHIGVLDFLSIEVEEDKTNPIIDRIDDLVTFAERYSYIYIAGLVQEKDKEIYNDIHKKINRLKAEVEMYKKSEITLEDIISVSFKISENGKDLGTLYTLNDVGSNGTGIMVRSIIYISLLYKNSIKCRIDENQIFHCIIDEIGQISENYFEELMAFAKEKGFSFLNGIPVNAEEMIALYPTIYTGYREKDTSIMLNTTKEIIEIEI